MRRTIQLALVVLAILAGVWLVFSWFEADKEIRVLCSGFHHGMEREHVVAALETGEYLRYRIGPESETILVDSLYNLGSSGCAVQIEDGMVVASGYK